MARHRHEKPKPIGTIIGVVACLGGIAVFVILMKMGFFAPKRNVQPLPPPSGTSGSGTGQPGTGDPALPAGSKMVQPKFIATPIRSVVFPCPACGKNIPDANLPKCPACGESVTWPIKVRCEFCSGTGNCLVCKGTGKCRCAQNPGQMGVMPGCNLCNNSRKCQACGGLGKCKFCESGSYFLGQSKSSSRPPPEPPPLPQPE